MEVVEYEGFMGKSGRGKEAWVRKGNVEKTGKEILRVADGIREEWRGGGKIESCRRKKERVQRKEWKGKRSVKGE